MTVGEQYRMQQLSELKTLLPKWITLKASTASPDITVPTHSVSTVKRKVLGVPYTKKVVENSHFAGWIVGDPEDTIYVLEDGTLWMTHLVRRYGAYTKRLKASFERMNQASVDNPYLPVEILQVLLEQCRQDLRATS